VFIDQAKSIYFSAVESVKPANLINNNLSLSDNILTVKSHTFDLSSYKHIYVIGAGKASAYMAGSLEDKMGKYITSGFITVKYEHSVLCKKIQINEAGHPIPDENSIKATLDILRLANKANADDLVIVLLSGGGSALMEDLADDISLADLQNLNNTLISCGADIKEINTVRKHISLVKGGQLAQEIYPATCLTLIISDVPGDDLGSIASGPTAADASTFWDAMEIVDKYSLQKKISKPIMNYLQSGINGKVQETLKRKSKIWDTTSNVIIGNNIVALQAAKKEAESLDFNVNTVNSDMHGEAKEVAKSISKKLKNLTNLKEAQCFLYGGETTVTKKGKGKGGRNQELALAVLIELKDFNRPFTLLSCGTDGTDGPTDAAGAIIQNDTWEKVKLKNIDPAIYLRNNDSYNFFMKTGGSVKTGPTGTNVMDLVVVIIAGL